MQKGAQLSWVSLMGPDGKDGPRWATMGKMVKRTTPTRQRRGQAHRGVRRRGVSDLEAVRRAVCGTLNREVEVEVEKKPSGRRGVTLVVKKRRSPLIVLEHWEMDAMRKVPLVPAHLRGHFLRNYAILTGQRAAASSPQA